MSKIPQAKEYWQAAFNAIFNPDLNAENEISKYFTPSYIQITDGKSENCKPSLTKEKCADRCALQSLGVQSNFEEFVHHIGVVRSHISSAVFEFHEYLTDGESVAWRHIASMSMKDGRTSEFEVFLIGQMSNDGRLERVVESTRKVRGKEGDENLGRRT